MNQMKCKKTPTIVLGTLDVQCFGIIRASSSFINCIIIIFEKILITIWQVFLKSKIMDNIHKYYFLIAFTAYMRYYKRQFRQSPSSLAL